MKITLTIIYETSEVNFPDQGQLLFILYCGILVVGQQKIVHSMTRKISIH